MVSDELESKPEREFGSVCSEHLQSSGRARQPAIGDRGCRTQSVTNSSKDPFSAVLRSPQMLVGPDPEETRAQTVQKSPECPLQRVPHCCK